MRRISSIGRAIPIRRPTAATGRTMRSVSARWPGSPRASGSATSRASCRTSSTATTGRPGSRWPISPIGDERRPATVLTVHNLAFQGQFPPDLLGRLRLPPHALRDRRRRELRHDRLPQGRPAIRRPHHHGVADLRAGNPDAGQWLRPRRAAARCAPAVLSGIRNGIDVDVWNPETDPRIASRFDARRSRTRGRRTRRRCSSASASRRMPARLLFAVVSRMAWQKGLDLLADAVPALVARGAQLAVLGTGDPELEQRLTRLAQGHRGQVGCIVGYDEDLAHLIQAGADAMLVPSRFEPCGLTQLCAMRYGAIPIVAKVGRPCRHDHRPRAGAAPGRDRPPLFPGDTGGARSGAATRRRSAGPTARPGNRCNRTACGPTCPGPNRPASIARLYRRAIGVQKLGIAGLSGTSAPPVRRASCKPSRKGLVPTRATGRGAP